MRYGILGSGMMGQEHIRNIALVDGAEVTGLVEPDPGMRARSEALAPRARSFASLEDMLLGDHIDALVIATPNDQHLGELERVAAARPLPVLVEKPLYTQARERARIEALARDYPAPIWVAMEYRYMPPIQRFLETADDATGGIKMLTIREHRFPFLEKVGDWNRFNTRTGGTLVEKCCHFFDLMRLALGDEPVRVTASGGQAVNHVAERYSGAQPDIWDHAYVIVEFAGGARAMLDLCMFAEGARFQEEITAAGPEGRIEARVPGPGRFWPPSLGPAPVADLRVAPRQFGREAPESPRQIEIPVDPALLEAGDHNGATFYQHQRFLAAIQAGTEPEVSLADGMAAVRMGLAAQAASIEARVIDLADWPG
ncbi:MAG: Gfo/Idh/MocA family oxidoreductase [Pseudomonadota bacterium]